jgi:hypothetical protein
VYVGDDEGAEQFIDDSTSRVDLVVLDENLFEMDRQEIHKIKPAAVMMEGELVHGDLR